jgi:hypothetical protein
MLLLPKSILYTIFDTIFCFSILQYFKYYQNNHGAINMEHYKSTLLPEAHRLSDFHYLRNPSFFNN